MAKQLHIQLYDQIGGDFFGGGTTAKSISEQLQANSDAEEIILHINSPGGSVYEGYTIYNLLKSSGKKITAKIEGFCASIATLIALSADEIEMLPLAQWLIHNPFTEIQGDAADLLNAAAELQRIEGVLVGIYVARTGKPEDEIRALMNEDKFISAEDAVSMGFANRISEPLKAVAFFKPINQNSNMSKPEKLSPLAKLKDAIIAAFTAVEEPQNAVVETDNGSLYYDGELSENTACFSDEAMMIPAADGQYIITATGEIVTVLAGIVTKIEAATPPSNNAEELATANAKVAELEAQLAGLIQASADNEALLAAKEAVILNLKAIVPGAKATVNPAQAHAEGNEPTGGKRVVSVPSLPENSIASRAAKSAY